MLVGAFSLFYNFLYLFLTNRQFVDIVFQPLSKIFFNFVCPSGINLPGCIFSFFISLMSKHISQSYDLRTFYHPLR